MLFPNAFCFCNFAILQLGDLSLHDVRLIRKRNALGLVDSRAGLGLGGRFLSTSVVVVKYYRLMNSTLLFLARPSSVVLGATGS